MHDNGAADGGPAALGGGDILCAECDGPGSYSPAVMRPPPAIRARREFRTSVVRVSGH